MCSRTRAAVGILAATTWLGCGATTPMATPERVALPAGDNESPLALIVDCSKPLVVEDWATVTIRLTNRSAEPVQVWLRTWDDGRESLPICEEFRNVRYDMTQRAIPCGANRGWADRTLAPAESLARKLSFHVQLLYEGEHELVCIYDPLALENVAQEVKDARPVTARSEPVPVRVANGNRIPVLEDDCDGVLRLHPDLAVIPEALARKTSLLLIDWTPEDISGLSEWARRATGVRLASTASEYREVVRHGQISFAYGVFITCDIRSAPLHRVFDVLAHLWKPDVRWRFKDGVVTFYEEAPSDDGAP